MAVQVKRYFAVLVVAVFLVSSFAATAFAATVTNEPSGTAYSGVTNYTNTTMSASQDYWKATSNTLAALLYRVGLNTSTSGTLMYELDQIRTKLGSNTTTSGTALYLLDQIRQNTASGSSSSSSSPFTSADVTKITNALGYATDTNSIRYYLKAIMDNTANSSSGSSSPWTASNISSLLTDLDVVKGYDRLTQSDVSAIKSFLDSVIVTQRVQVSDAQTQIKIDGLSTKTGNIYDRVNDIATEITSVSDGSIKSNITNIKESDAALLALLSSEFSFNLVGGWNPSTTIKDFLGYIDDDLMDFYDEYLDWESQWVDKYSFSNPIFHYRYGNGRPTYNYFHTPYYSIGTDNSGSIYDANVTTIPDLLSVINANTVSVASSIFGYAVSNQIEFYDYEHNQDSNGLANRVYATSLADMLLPFQWLQKQVSKIQYMIASDDDLALKQQQQANTDFVKDNILSGSDSSTSVGTGSLGSMKNLGDGVHDLFDTGVSPSAVLDVLGSSGDDSPWAWFTQATADDLDSTGSAGGARKARAKSEPEYIDFLSGKLDDLYGILEGVSGDD